MRQYLDHVRRVSPLLRNASITIKIKMFVLRQNYQPPGSYHSNQTPGNVGGNGVCIPVLQCVRTQTEVRPFLRLSNVCCQFVPELSKLTAPLNQRLDKKEPKAFLTLARVETQSVDALKSDRRNPPVLVLPVQMGSNPSTQLSVLHRLDVYCSKHKMAQSTGQYDIGHEQ